MYKKKLNKIFWTYKKMNEEDSHTYRKKYNNKKDKKPIYLFETFTQVFLRGDAFFCVMVILVKKTQHKRYTIGKKSF